MSLFDHIDKFRKNVAFVDEKNNTYFYNDLLNDVKEFNQHTNNRSIILIIGSNSYEVMVAYVHSIRNKLVPILIDDKTDVQYIEKIVKQYFPEYIYIPNTKKIVFDLYKKKEKFRNYNLLKIKKKINYNIFDELALLILQKALISDAILEDFLTQLRKKLLIAITDANPTLLQKILNLFFLLQNNVSLMNIFSFKQKKK